MKRLLFVALALFAFIRLADAHAFAPPGVASVAASDAVYLVRVASVKDGKVTFSITEVLRGKPQDSLSLTPYTGGFEVNSEWILVHHVGGFKDCVGWALKGDCEWLPVRITRDGDKATAQWLGPLDQVREYLRQHPAKS